MTDLNGLFKRILCYVMHFLGGVTHTGITANIINGQRIVSQRGHNRPVVSI